MLPSFEDVVDKGKGLVEDNFWIHIDVSPDDSVQCKRKLDLECGLSNSLGSDEKAIKEADAETHSEFSCLAISIYSGVMAAFVCLFVFICRDYIKYLLLYLDSISAVWSFLVLVLLFTAVSFPLTWGYVLLNIAAGYLYGFFIGVVNVVLSAFVGVAVAHCTMRYLLQSLILKRFASSSVMAFLRVVDGASSMRVVILARLTPIPFGLQNALFAISQVRNISYFFSSFLGMLPTQCLNAYLGSTIRSMEEVVASTSNSVVAYCLLAAQLIATVALVVFMSRKAKMELDKALDNLTHEQQQGPKHSLSVSSTKQSIRPSTEITLMS